MPVPVFHYCIVCEDLRPEPNGLATILGFYGLAPDVVVYLKEFNKPLRQLTFSVMGGPGQIQGMLSFEVTDEKNFSHTHFISYLLVLNQQPS